LGNNDLKLY